MQKKIKYSLGIATYNTYSHYIDISHKQYTQLKTMYDKEIEDNHAYYSDNWEDREQYIYKKEYTPEEHEKYTEYRTEYNDGATYINLVKLECKEGYAFKK